MTQPPTQPAASASDSLTGRTLGQFEILDEIGRGGMATVYRARQLTMNRSVAIKVLPRALMHDPSFIERFRREVDVIAHLEHPHILPIYDYGEVDGVPFIAMRYLAGGSLAQLLRRGLPRLPDLIRPVTQVAQALDHAHQQGIIHRDLKPGNILLDETGNAYLTDFGIARVINSSLTGSAIIGTPAYMSPEQANGLPLDARSDIYALGVVLFELLTGREPYEAETPVALLLKHITEPMPSPRSLRADLPGAVESVIFRATAKHPDDRYPSAGELAAAFAEAARQPASAGTAEDQPTLIDHPAAPIAAVTPPRMTPRRVTAVNASAAPVAADAAGTLIVNETAAVAPAVTRGRTVPLPWLALAIVALLAVIAGGVIALTNQPPAPVVLPPPTPFNRGVQTVTNRYSLTVPQGWQFADLTGTEPILFQADLVHVWQRVAASGPPDAYIGLTLFPSGSGGHTISDVWGRVQSRYEPDAAYRLIDTFYSDDVFNRDVPGVLRRSYRVEGETTPPLPFGQLDVFVGEQAGSTFVLELFTADTAADVVPTMQQVLNSLRVVAPTVPSA